MLKNWPVDNLLSDTDHAMIQSVTASLSYECIMHIADREYKYNQQLRQIKHANQTLRIHCTL